MIIKIPNVKDYDAINKMAVKLHDLHVNWRPDIFLHTSIIFTKEEFTQLIDEKLIFTANIDNKIVGYIIIGKITETEKSGYNYRKQLEIEAIFVDEEYRHNGIGKKLVMYIINYAKEHNCTDVKLTVNEENESAKKMYESIGMKVKNISYNINLN